MTRKRWGIYTYGLQRRELTVSEMTIWWECTLHTEGTGESPVCDYWLHNREESRWHTPPLKGTQMDLYLPLPPNSTEYNLFTCLKNRLNLGHCSLYLNGHLPRHNAFTMDTLNIRGHNLLSEYLSGNKEFLSQLVCICVRERQRQG